MKLYGFSYTKVALDSLAQLPKKVRKQVRNKIESLSTNPQPVGVRLVRGITDNGNSVFRIRSGDYRVLFSVRNDTLIVVLDIGHRKDVYRGMK